MKKNFYTFCIAIASLLLPSYAFAQGSIIDNIDNSIFELSALDVNLFDHHGLSRSVEPSGDGANGEGYGPGGRYSRVTTSSNSGGKYSPSTSNNGSGKYSTTTSYNNGGSYSSGTSYRGGTSTYIRSRRVYHHNNYNYRPQPRVQYQAAPVVVRQQASVIQPTETYDVQMGVDTTFTMGLRAVGFYPGKLTSLNGESLRFKTSGGIGFYSRYRPVRWVSLEFITDVTFGKDEDCTSYFRMPVSLGLQLHIFDYGMLNVYGVAAASVTVVNTNSENIKDRYYQYGGQFGAGASIMLGALELGIDVRYTIDSPPEAFTTFYGNFIAKDELQHGVVFAANIGLAF